MHKRSVKFAVPLVVVSAAVLAVSTGLASAGTSTGGAVRVYEADTHLAGTVGTVIVTGAITDHGTDHQGAGPHASNLFVLSKGSFAVDVSTVGNELSQVAVDETTCSSEGTVTGRTSIVTGSGTGAYRGITGTLDVKVSVASILPRAHGTCDTNATRYPGVLMVKGSGTVSY